MSRWPCFENAAAHLAAGGAFVIEVGSPELRLLPPGQTGVVFAMDDDHWGLDEYDVANQGLISHHFERVDGVLQRHSLPFRYAFPAEFDLMAQLAGMTLQDRLERLGPVPVHERVEQARLGLAEVAVHPPCEHTFA